MQWLATSHRILVRYAAMSAATTGEWHVGWGGRTIDLNQHAVARDQRFAYDFFIKREGYTFKGDGSVNEDY
jgi:hypothetical protein